MNGVDFILNGTGTGEVAATLLQHGMDHRVLKPWIGANGATYINQLKANGEITAVKVNSVGLLRKEEWVLLDTAVVKAANLRLRAVKDLINNGLTYNIPNAIGTTVFQSQAMSDLNDAGVSMTGLEETTNEKLQFDLRTIPLPIIHKDLTIPIRLLAASRNSGAGALDTLEAEIAGRKVAEMAEKILIGVEDLSSIGGNAIYGYTTFPQRQTTTISDWEDKDTSGKTMRNELINMIKIANGQRCWGPFQVYITPGIDLQLERDFSDDSDKTIRSRLLDISAISGITALDFLPEKTVLLVPMGAETVRMLMGLMPQTLQWESKGGMLAHLKVMAIMVPQLRADFYGRCGIVHASYSGS